MLGIALIVAGCTAGESGQVGVVRNGGPFDNRNIREIIHQGESAQWRGFFSEARFYPAASTQRYYTITSEAGRGDTNQVARVQTRDGILVGIEGTFYLTTTFDGSKEGDERLKEFDTVFGTRSFPRIHDQGTVHAWEGDSGWSAFLDAIVRPVIDNEIRSTVGQFTCRELISSCGLVANQGQAVVNPQDSGSNFNLSKIQDQIDSSLQSDLNSTLGEEYFGNIKFKLARVTLSSDLQDAIEQAQAAFAQVSQAQAKVETAKKTAQANAELAEQYKRYPVLAQIEMIKQLPEGTNVYFGVQPTVVAGGAGR